MSVSQITENSRSAIVTQLAAENITCYPYTPWDIPKQQHAAIGTPSWELVEHPDQSYGIRSITFPIRLYQAVTADTDTTLGYADAMLATAIDALGSDRTLGGKVASSDASGPVTQDYYREANGQAYSVVTLELQVWPFPNTGA